MKIAMIGCGAAGSCFASYLRKGGADITLVDLYKEHMDKVASDGMEFCVYPDQVFYLNGFKTATSAENIGIMDIVIFVTKVTQLDSALETAKPCIGPDTVLVSLMNGLGNEDRLMKVVPADRVIYGSGVLGTELNGPGSCTVSPGAPGTQMNFGPVEHSPLTDAAGAHLEKCFNDGGCEAKYWDDVKPLTWKKAIINCVMNPICALTRMKVKDVSADPNGLALLLQVLNECCAVANAYGVPLTAPIFLADLKASMGNGITDYYPSMAQDMLMFKRQTEIATLNGAIVKYGKAKGVPTPVNNVITLMVSAMQKNYDKLYSDYKLYTE